MFPIDVVRMADPRSPFERTDNIETNAPRTRLIWGVHKCGMYLVHYEFGGIVSGQRLSVVAYKETDSTATRLWIATSIYFQSFYDFSSFLSGRAVVDH